jgi:hypothetical protein
VRRAVIGSLIIVTVSTLTGFTDVDGPSDFCDAVHDGARVGYFTPKRPGVIGIELRQGQSPFPVCDNHLERARQR